jgi:hypothetical protein
MGRLIGRRSGAVPLFRETEPKPALIDAMSSPEPKVLDDAVGRDWPGVSRGV